jgi:hypothetical protein
MTLPRQLRYTRASARALAVFVKAALRWTVVQKVTKQQAKQVKIDNNLLLILQKNIEEEFCLICWESLFPSPQPEEESTDTISKTVTSSCTASPRLEADPGSPIEGSEKPPLLQTTSPLSSRRSSAPNIGNEICLISQLSPPSESSTIPASEASSDQIIRCAKGHHYHLTCLKAWIIERNEKAPRSCEMCTSPYIGPDGRALTSQAIQQTLQHHEVLPFQHGRRRRSEQVCEAALVMLYQFKSKRPQFFNAKHRGQYNLSLEDVDREFLAFFDVPVEDGHAQGVVAKAIRAVRTDGVLNRSAHIRLFRLAIEVLERHCQEC